MKMNEQEQRQMNEDIGELISALGMAYGLLTIPGVVQWPSQITRIKECYDRIGVAHRDRQSRLRVEATDDGLGGDFMPMQSSADYSGDTWGT